TASSAAWVGVEQLAAATSSSSVRSVWWPIEAITGTASSATVRHRLSSEKASRSVGEPPPRATTITSTSPLPARSRSASRMRGAAVLDRREGPHDAARPAAADERGGEVLARLARLGRDDPDRAGQQRARQRPLAIEQALRRQHLAALLDLREQVALAGHAQRR